MNKFVRELCSKENLKFDSDSSSYTGYKMGYPFLLSMSGNRYELIFSVSNGTFPDLAMVKQLVRSSAAISSCKVSGYRVNYAIKPGIGKKAIMTNISLAITDSVRFLSASGYSACCEESGETDNVSAYIVAGDPKILSENSFLNASKGISAKELELSKKRENIIAGIAGALIGSILGAGAIVLIAQIGYVSIWGGLLMGILTIKGYELLSGKFSIKGMLISVVIMIGMVYLSNQLDWTFTIMHEAEVGFKEAFAAVNEVVELAGLKMTYYKNLGLLYLFTLIGAIPMLISVFKANKAKKNAYKM